MFIIAENWEQPKGPFIVEKRLEAEHLEKERFKAACSTQEHVVEGKEDIEEYLLIV